MAIPFGVRSWLLATVRTAAMKAEHNGSDWEKSGRYGERLLEERI